MTKELSSSKSQPCNVQAPLPCTAAESRRGPARMLCCRRHALLLRQSYLHTHIPSQSVFVCRHACIIHIGGFVDLRVEACIEEIFQSCCCVSLHGHLQACRGTLQPDSSVHHMMSVKRPTTLNQEEKRDLWVLSMPRHSGSSPARLCFAGRLMHFMKLGCMLLVQLLYSLGCTRALRKLATECAQAFACRFHAMFGDAYIELRRSLFRVPGFDLMA